jgi:hypothetical protein
VWVVGKRKRARVPVCKYVNTGTILESLSGSKYDIKNGASVLSRASSIFYIGDGFIQPKTIPQLRDLEELHEE